MARMKVPINPTTRVPTGQLGFQRAVDISSGTRALGQVVQQYGEYVLAEDKKREQFDIQKRLVDETNNLLTDFEQKREAQPLGAPGFTKFINDDYTARHQAMEAELRELGYSEDAISEFATRLGTIRSQYVAKAIDFQDKSGFAKVGKDIDDLSIGLSQYANNNPNAVQSAIDELQVALQNSGLDEIEQLQMFEVKKAEILQGARQGYALQNPEQVIGLFDPEDQLAPPGSSTVGLTNLDSNEQTVSTEFTNAGFKPIVTAGFLGNFKVEGGYTGKKGDGGNSEGIAQWNIKGSPERVANFVRIIGKPISQATIAEQAKFAVWEMQNPEEAGMTVEQRNAILNAKTPEEAAELIDRYYERSDGTHRERRKEAAKLYISTMAKADEVVTNLTDPLAPLPMDEKGMTGIPIIDMSTGPERMQMLAWAKQYAGEKKSTAKAELQVTHTNAVNAYLATGGYSGNRPTAEDYVRILGPVEGPQKFAELENSERVGQNIQQFKTLPNSAIAAQVEALRPKDTSSPTYTEELQAYTRAQQAADEVIKAREENPSGYVFSTFPAVAKQLQNADSVNERRAAYAAVNESYKRLGISPDKRYLMTTEQAKELQEKYTSLPPKVKIQQLQQWSTELGELYDPFMRQLTNDGYDAGEDSVMWSMLKDHPNGFSIMSQVLAGQQIITDDPARKPGADVINTKFKDTVGSALSILNPAASKIYNDAAAAIYVANGGRTDAQLFDPDLYAESLRLAVGGIPKNENSGIVDMSQGAVKDWTIVPRGITGSQFTNWVERLTPGVLTRMSLENSQPLYRTGNPVPLRDIIDEGVFVAVAPGHYIIKMASDGNPLKTASGNNFVVRINLKDAGRPWNAPARPAIPRTPVAAGSIPVTLRADRR